MNWSQRLLATLFIGAGVMHFVKPRAYEAIMPPALPRHPELVLVSGAAEIVGGLAILPAGTRRLAGWWLVALLAAVFPANVHMAANPAQIRGLDQDRVPGWLLWTRLPLQPVLMAWVWRSTQRG